MKKKTKPKIFIVEDDRDVAALIKELCTSVGFRAQIFFNAIDYLNVEQKETCGCILIDVRLPGIMSGLELLEELKKMTNNLPVIMMTAYADVPMAVRALQTGAINFITKPFNNQLLIEAVQKGVELSLHQSADPIYLYQAKYEQLTQREKEILQLIANGKLNKQIANELHISNSTVELHRANVMHKMEAKSIANLVKMYLLLEINHLLKPLVFS